MGYELVDFMIFGCLCFGLSSRISNFLCLRHASIIPSTGKDF